MPDASREALRARAREFVGSAAFGRHYEKLHISTRIHLGKLAVPADKAVQRMISDAEYQAFRKRPLPAGFTDGRAAHFLDVKIDNELLRGHRLYKASEFYFLVDPSPRGLILQVPQVDQAVPSPQATGA